MELHAVFWTTNSALGENQSTTQQIHRIINSIKKVLKKKKLCNAIFLDIVQMSIKSGRLVSYTKSKRYLLLIIHACQIKHNFCYSNYHPIQSRVPQGIMLGPLLYLVLVIFDILLYKCKIKPIQTYGILKILYK